MGTSKKMPKETLEKYLDLLYFVKWDRYTEAQFDPWRFQYTFFGWIDRKKDNYKDFIVLRICGEKDGEEQDVEYTTSSADRSKEIGELLGFPEDDHIDCKRVESFFDVENSVRLF